MRLRSRPEKLAAARAEAKARALAAGFGAADAEGFASAVHEATTNAMEHGNRGQPDLWVTVEFAETPEALVARVLDEGPGIPSAPEGPESYGERGRGFRLMRALVDEVRIGTGDGEVVLVKRKPRAAE